MLYSGMKKSDIIAPNSGIYQLYDKQYRLYIGSSTNLKRRKREHFYRLDVNDHENKKLQNYYNKYGKDSLSFKVILYCSTDSLLDIEQAYLDNLNPYFNLSPTVNSTLGYKHTSESKLKMSKSKIKLYKEKDQWNKGRDKPKKEREKISQSLKEYYKNNPHPRQGTIHSEETKDKISKKLEERKGEYHKSDNGVLCQISLKNDSVLNIFISTGEAADKADLDSKGNHKTRRTKILEATKIKGRTAYGYKWEWRKPRPNKTG